MADARISDLTQLLGAAVDVDLDVLPIVDSSAGTSGTKKIPVKELVSGTSSFLPAGTGGVAESVQAALRRLVFSGQYSSGANFNTARDALTDTLGAAAISLKTAGGIAATENTTTGAGMSLLELTLSQGDAPFQIHVSPASQNTGAGAGTYNHGTFFGYNVQRHSAIGSATSNTPSLIMGFENDYFDDGGDNHHGAEWYIEYWSPNGTSVQLYRPMYARIFNDDNTSHAAKIYNDIGTDGDGDFTVYAGLAAQLLYINATAATFTIPLSGTVLTMNYAKFISDISYNTTTDRVSVGTIPALPSNSNGLYIGWANGISGTLAGDLLLIPRSSVAGALRVYTGTTGPSQRFIVDAVGNVVVGNAQLANNATDGFLYIPTTTDNNPSGTPTSYTGRVAMVYDDTNHELFVYSGAWRSVALT